MKQEIAETVGAEALAWLASDDDLLPAFLNATGSDLDDLRRGAGRPDYLAAVLDFLMNEDAWVMAFCDAHGHGYEVPMRARQSLPGGTGPNWT